MSGGWDRSKDALIARVAEGLQLHEYHHDGLCVVDNADDPPVYSTGVRLAHYNLNLAAAVRAAEAWCHKNPEGGYRAMDITYQPWSLHRQYNVYVSDQAAGESRWGSWAGEASTLDEALAWALYRACGGAER